jgi:hypothetical protein
MIVPEGKQYKLAAMLIHTGNNMNGMVFAKCTLPEQRRPFLVLTLYYQ